VKQKIYIVLFLFTFFLSSCTNKVDYYFEIININETGKPKVEFSFSEINDRSFEKTYKINTDKSTHIRVEAGLACVGTRFEGVGKMYYYPEFKQIPNGGLIQIFLYNYPYVEHINDNTFVLAFGENVHLYFLYMLKDDQIITMISKDNYFKLSETIIENYDFLKMKEVDFQDVTIIDPYDSRMRFAVEHSNGILGGYIIKNNFDELLLWIN
jgi:hypothetical protein